ncbi:hypothetical protein HK104_002322, partial [Borealophlyctis nickersoniae]
MELCIDENEDGGWRADVVQDVNRIGLAGQDWADTQWLRFLGTTHQPFNDAVFPPVEDDIAWAMDSLRDPDYKDDDSALVEDLVMEDEWVLDDVVVKTDANGVVAFCEELQLLEHLANSNVEGIVGGPVEELLKVEKWVSKRKPPEMEERLLPAKVTHTSAATARDPPLPSIAELGKRIPQLSLTDPKYPGCPDFLEYASKKDQPIVQQDTVELLMEIMDPVGMLLKAHGKEGGDDFKGMCDIALAQAAKQARLALDIELEVPLIPSRRDTTVIPPANFLSSQPNTNIEDGAGLFASIEWIPTGGPMSLKDSPEQIVPGESQRGFIEESMEIEISEADRKVWDDVKDAMRDRTSEKDILDLVRPEESAAKMVERMDGGDASCKRKQLVEFEVPIFPKSKEPEIGEKRARTDDLPLPSMKEAIDIAAATGPNPSAATATQDDEERESQITSNSNPENDLIPVFDSLRGAGIRGLLDAEFDIVSSKRIPVPSLPLPPPFHPTTDPWPTFRHFILQTLALRPFTDMAGVEVTVLHWNPIKAMEDISGHGRVKFEDLVFAKSDRVEDDESAWGCTTDEVERLIEGWKTETAIPLDPEDRIETRRAENLAVLREKVKSSIRPKDSSQASVPPSPLGGPSAPERQHATVSPPRPQEETNPKCGPPAWTESARRPSTAQHVSTQFRDPGGPSRLPGVATPSSASPSRPTAAHQFYHPDTGRPRTDAVNKEPVTSPHFSIPSTPTRPPSSGKSYSPNEQHSPMDGSQSMPVVPVTKFSAKTSIDEFLRLRGRKNSSKSRTKPSPRPGSSGFGVQPSSPANSPRQPTPAPTALNTE